MTARPDGGRSSSRVVETVPGSTSTTLLPRRASSLEMVAPAGPDPATSISTGERSMDRIRSRLVEMLSLAAQVRRQWSFREGEPAAAPVLQEVRPPPRDRFSDLTQQPVDACPVQR